MLITSQYGYGAGGVDSATKTSKDLKEEGECNNDIIIINVIKGSESYEICNNQDGTNETPIKPCDVLQ